MCSNELKRTTRHFNWNLTGSPYPIDRMHLQRPNLALHMLLGLKVVVTGTKLSVNLILNVIEVRF